MFESQTSIIESFHFNFFVRFSLCKTSIFFLPKIFSCIDLLIDKLNSLGMTILYYYFMYKCNVLCLINSMLLKSC